MNMDKYWETLSDEHIEGNWRREIDDIHGEMRKNAIATRGDAIAVFRMEEAMRETGEWQKWRKEYYDDWVFYWEDAPAWEIEHFHGDEVDEMLEWLRTAEPNATRKDAIEELRSEYTQKAIRVAHEMDRNDRRNDPVMIAQRQAAIYAVMANKDDARD
jgi:hypothetical protein